MTDMPTCYEGTCDKGGIPRYRCSYHRGYEDGYDAALPTAPTVEDAVFCGAHPDGWLVMPNGCGQRDCPGPHRELIVGEEIS